ncbi:MAG: ribonuclease HII [Bacteroidales bacterium]
MLKSTFSELEYEAGCDEAGRGCLAGPVFAAAVILPKDYLNEHLNDSKKLNLKQRNSLRVKIEKEAISWAVASVDPEKIDEINILNASILAMQLAVGKLTVKPHFLIIDGNRFRSYKEIPFQCIVKGDEKYLSIAAASVLAKTYRDDFMAKIHTEFPHYKWEKNKGYPTAEHKKSIADFGITHYHRKSFKLNEQLKFDFK